MVQRREFTQSVPLPSGTDFSSSIESDSGYTPGTLNITSGTLEEDTTIRATPAVQTKCIITTFIYEHQYIIIKVYDTTGTTVIKEYSNESISPQTAETNATTLAYGTKYSVSVVAREGYIKSTLINIVEDQIYSMSKNITVSTESEASVIECKLKILPTVNQKITLTTSAGTSLESDSEDEVYIIVPYWTKFTCTIEADPGYSPGVLNYSSETTVTSTLVEVYASSAKELKRRVIINKYDHQYIKVTSTFNEETTVYTVDSPDPVESTSSYNIYEIFDSSVFTVELIPSQGYQSMYPILEYTESGETEDILDIYQEYTLSENIELYAYNKADASITYHSITLIQSKGQTMKLTSGQYEDITGTVNLAHNSEFSITITANDTTYYDPGEVISSNDELTKNGNTYTGTITGDNMMYATPAVLK